MTAEILNWLLGIAAMFMAGTNIIQLLQIRSLKRKGAAEAEESEINNLSRIIDLQGKQIEQQDVKYNNLLVKYDDLRENYDLLVSALRQAGIAIPVKPIN